MYSASDDPGERYTATERTDGRERENNVKNAFQSPDNVVKYKRILIVDDIYTTGSTVEAVAERLKEAGAEQVYVLTACIGRGF